MRTLPRRVHVDALDCFCHPMPVISAAAPGTFPAGVPLMIHRDPIARLYGVTPAAPGYISTRRDPPTPRYCYQFPEPIRPRSG